MTVTFNDQSKSSKPFFNLLGDEIDEFIENVVIENIEEFTREESKTRAEFFNLPVIEDEDQIIEEKPFDKNILRNCCQNKEFIRKLMMYLDNKYLNLKSNFEYLVNIISY